MTADTTVATVKCLVWDLDDTLWSGTLLEGDDPQPAAATLTTLRILDERGVLHAVASRGDHATATAHLARLGLAELFTVLEIGWGAKSASVHRVSRALGVAVDSLAFVDNDPVERAEVAAAHPRVRCYQPEHIAGLPELPEFRPAHVTAESRVRREMYRAESSRKQAQETYDGAPADFLASLDLELTVRDATADDLARAHELTVRTHQLNTTGRTYDLDELRQLCDSPGHRVLVAQLRDVYGSYGTIGLVVTEQVDDRTVLRLLLLSCRVMSRGIGPALIGHVVRETLAAGRRPEAEFVPTAVNRAMLVNLRFAGFRPRAGSTPAAEGVTPRADCAPAAEGVPLVLEFPPGATPPAVPGHVRLVTPSGGSDE